MDEEYIYIFASVWVGVLIALAYDYFDARPGLELPFVLLFTNWYINNYTLPFFREYELYLPFLLSEQDVPDDASGGEGRTVSESVGAGQLPSMEGHDPIDGSGYLRVAPAGLSRQ